ncbi:MAG: PAS domain S-box protein [Alphaproteobacteria bacterium]|nr:PAS domain S-box protein [Alphaproteobacteria bacterium]
MANVAHTATSGAAPSGVALKARQLVGLGLRGRFGAVADVLGVRAVVWGTVAFLLLVLGLGAASMAIVLSLRLTTLHRDHEMSARLAGVYDDLRVLTTDLLVVVTSDPSQARMSALRSSWRRIAGDVAGICDSVGSPAQDDRNYLTPVCARFHAAEPMLDVLLSGDALALPAQRAAVERLAELVDTVRSFEDDHNKLSADQNLRLGEQRRLMIILSGATAGGLLSGLALAYVVTGAAAAYRRRWLAASEAEHAATETRAQLVEAIEAIPVGFGLYDRDARLMMFNDRLAGMNRAIYTPDLIGKSHREVVEAAAAAQSWRWPTVEEREAWMERQFARFRDGKRGDTQDRGDGHWFEFFEIRTPSGLTASIRHDVTEHKRYQQQLEASEHRYRELVDSLVDVVFTSSPDGRFTYGSPAVQTVLGMTPQEFVGRTAASVVHPDDHRRFGAALRAARLAPQQTQAMVLRVGPTPDNVRFAEVRFRPTAEVGPDGHVGFTGILRDVHEQVLMERRQRDDTLKLRSIVESAGALILLIDRDLKVVLANRTFLAATGDATREVAGLPFEDVVVCSIDKAVLAGWLAHEGLSTLDPVEFDNVIPMPDGGRRIVRVTASPVQDDTGRVNYILFLGVDETARRSAEVQLLDAARLATVGQMATGIAHEINQPLTVIGFSAESLLDDMSEGLDSSDPQDFREALTSRLKRIEDQTHRAANIVRQLRIFARKPNEVPAPFDVTQAIRDGVELISEQLRLARFDIELDIAPDLPTVIGHPNRLQQVLVNLIVNARDAIEEARAHQPDMKAGRWIGIRAYRMPGRDAMSIEVSDNGPGIPAEVLPRLFEPFFTTKPSGKGTGLGLSISSEIVREMSGTIAATNRLQGGAVFRLNLPSAG